jgi:hypothetical protein
VAPATTRSTCPNGHAVRQEHPNLRRATAIVNGDIITGTDVDQRLALVLAANGGKISDEERTSCARRCCAT